MPMPSKPCGYCESLTHWPYQCYKNPHLKKWGWKGSRSYDKPITKSAKTHGKSYVKWIKTRTQWFIENAADYYTCYLCHKSLMPYETTLDHVVPRSHDATLRYDFKNLKPCCYTCNSKKGSQSLENYLKNS